MVGMTGCAFAPAAKTGRFGLRPASRPRGRGFTLIELLVVLVVLALFSGMTIISIGDSFQRKLLAEAERLQAVMIAASDEAIFTANEFGFYFTDSGYQVLRWNHLNQGWVATSSQAFKLHALPDGMVMRVNVEGFAVPQDDSGQQAELVELEFGSEAEAVTFADEESAQNDQTGDLVDVTPQVLALSSAELSVFSVVFEAADQPSRRAAYKLSSDGFSLPRVRELKADGDEA